ncbi:MAG: MFS transporter [Thermoprotei archaeon]
MGDMRENFWLFMFFRVYLFEILLSIERGMLLLAIPLYALKLGASYSYVGLAVGSVSVGTMLFDIPSGFILSKMSERKFLFLTFLTLILSLLGIAFSESYLALIFFVIIFGVGVSFWSLVRHYMIAMHAMYDHRGRASSLVGASYRIGTFIGPILGGFLIANYGYQLTFLVGSLIIIMIIPIYLIYNRASFNHIILDHNENDISVSRTRIIWRWVILFGLGYITAQIIRYGRYFLIPVYGENIIILSEFQLGLVLGLSGFLSVLTSYPSGFIIDRLGRRFSVLISFLIMGLGFLFLAIFSDVMVFVIASMIIGVGDGFGSGIMITLGADIASKYDKGTASKFLGYWRFMGDIGNSLGPMLLGILSSMIALIPSSIILGIISMLFAVFMSELIGKSRECFVA